MRNSALKPITAAIGAVCVASLASTSVADAGSNPFGAVELSHGYGLLAHGEEIEGKCGASRTGENKDAEGTCGEGKCGEGKCGEGQCGEGRCGAAAG